MEIKTRVERTTLSFALSVVKEVKDRYSQVMDLKFVAETIQDLLDNGAGHDRIIHVEDDEYTVAISHARDYIQVSKNIIHLSLSDSDPCPTCNMPREMCGQAVMMGVAGKHGPLKMPPYLA